MILRGLALAVVLLSGTIAPASADYSFIGMGAASCGAWTASRRYPEAVSTGLYEQWILGFLSGVGAAGLLGINPLNGVDAQGVLGWIDNYCLANPLKMLNEAGKAFVYAHPR